MSPARSRCSSPATPSVSTKWSPVSSPMCGSTPRRAPTPTSTVGRHNGLVELVVSDDGPGMPPAALAHVFDRFYRADPSRSRRSGGSGLGLSIVDAIVTAHGGTVSANSKPGAGTSITVKLPGTTEPS